MANRRMFSNSVIDTDAFMDLPLSTQALYFHLCMKADDDGFIANPRRITRNIGAADDDLKILLMKRFILLFEDGVIVIKHWRMHNTIKSDRYKPTNYQDDLKKLVLKDNMSYTDAPPALAGGNTVEPDRNQDVSADKNSIEKNRLDKDSIGECEGENTIDVSEFEIVDLDEKPKKKKYGEFENVLLSDEEFLKAKTEFPDQYLDYIEKISAYCASSGKTYKNYLAAMREWIKRDKDKKPAKQEFAPRESISDDPIMKEWLERSQAKLEALRNGGAK